MFTGIIEAVGRVALLRRSESGAHLELENVPFAEELEIGESVAVNGCCLTVTGHGEEQSIHFDILAETLRATNLGDLRENTLVNLERALRVGDRMSGHYVQGHVDRTSTVLTFEPVGTDCRLEISLPPEFAHHVVYKGSITIDGISLTVAEVSTSSFTLWVIPHTHAITNLQQTRPGDEVNLEFDILSKYVERSMTIRER